MTSKTDSLTGGDPEIRHDEKSLAHPEAIAATLEVTGGRPDAFGKGHIKLYLCCVIIYFCSTMNGLLAFPNIEFCLTRRSRI